jgi:hypothetical protein
VSSEPPANGPEDVGWSDMDRRRAPLRYPIPPGTPARVCKSCPTVIFWIRTVAGKAMPVNEQGISHFADCPAANKHRRPR